MRRLVLAVAAGVAAELAGIGLMTTAVWLIMRAAEQPPLSALTVAIVAVRTLAVARGGMRTSSGWPGIPPCCETSRRFGAGSTTPCCAAR